METLLLVVRLLAGAVLFLLGVAMLSAGVALCIKGKTDLPGGRQLPARPARVAGVILASFFPAVIVAYVGTQFLSDGVALLLNWLIALSCLGSAFVVVWKSSAPAKSAAAPAATDVFEVPKYVEDDPLAEHARQRSRSRPKPT